MLEMTFEYVKLLTGALVASRPMLDPFLKPPISVPSELSN